MRKHYHSGIGLVTPESFHHGLAPAIIEARKTTLAEAWRLKPERFVHGVPRPASLPTAVWINPPKRLESTKKEAAEPNCPTAPADTSLTHRRSSYPLAGCVPAAPASVSPDRGSILCKTSLNIGAMPEKIPGVWGLAPEKHVC